MPTPNVSRISMTSAMRAVAIGGALLVGGSAGFAGEGGDYQSTVPDASSGPPMFGVEVTPPPSSVQTREGLTPFQGVYVQNVFPNTAAAASGVKPGDVVLQINGSPINSISDLRNEVGLNSVGDPVVAVVQRNGQQMTVSAPLQEWPKNIPRDRIDPESEKRFRQWQQDRLNQQHQAIDQAKEQVADLDRQLPQLPSPEAQQRSAELTREIAARAWQLSCRVASKDDGVVIAGADQPISASDPAAPGWRLAWASRPSTTTAGVER